MKSIEVKVDLRKTTGKKQSAELHRKGLIPCVMYGGKENVHFVGTLNDFRHIIYTPDIYVVKLEIEGEKKHLAILKEIQFHPVTDYPIHMDFIEAFEDKPTVVSLPVTISGNSAGVRAGGKMHQKKRYLKVKGLIKDLPETLNIDISDIEIGQYVKIGDLKYNKIELLDPARAMVVGVTTSRVAKGMELEETTPVAAIAEGTAEGAAEAPSEAPAKEK
jgi:large subunit ribosomal protein L25